jgi:hypothetical protein
MTSQLAWTTTDNCPACGRYAKLGDTGTLAIPETRVPGLWDDGNPMRILVFHGVCAPDYVLDYHKWLRDA